MNKERENLEGRLHLNVNDVRVGFWFHFRVVTRCIRVGEANVTGLD